jgi:hypothetical protein
MYEHGLLGGIQFLYKKPLGFDIFYIVKILMRSKDGNVWLYAFQKVVYSQIGRVW